MNAQGLHAIGHMVEDEAPPTRPPESEREEREEMPLPTEPRTVFLGGLFLLAVLAALYIASPIVLPVVLAIVLKLLLQPLVRLLERVRLPRGLGACTLQSLVWNQLRYLVELRVGPRITRPAATSSAIV